jgi:lipopolysaccharide/colanic/teichoic acid biosynthesis glycosyltransferase
MLKEKESLLQIVVMLLDAVLIVLAFVVAYFFRHHLDQLSSFNIFFSKAAIRSAAPSLSDYLVGLFLIVPSWCFILHLNGMYSSMRTRHFYEIIWIIFKSIIFLILIFGTIVFLFRLYNVSRLFFIFFIVLGFVFIFIEKIIIFASLHFLRKRGHGLQNVLVVGTGRRAQNIVKKLKNHPEWGFCILGAIDDEPGRGIEKVGDADIIGELHNLPNILHKRAVDEVIFVVPRSRLNHIKIAKSKPSEIENIPLISFETTVAKEWELFVKRMIDIVFSGLAILLLTPFLLVVSLLIKITSRGPIFFKQERLGLNGRRFVLYKFRTMYAEAEKELSCVDVNQEMDDPEFRKRKMQLITPVGRFLRKFSIDELPQLFNVFLGHMSLVGPRPCIYEEVKQYKPWQRRRLSMRPGITCLWQVSGRNNIPFEEWMKLDLEYLDNWSLWLDLKILLKTIPVTIFGIGAY